MTDIYRSVGPDGKVSYSDKHTAAPNATVVGGGKPNHTPGAVYTKVWVDGKEETWEYGRAEEYRLGLQEQLIQAKERAAREIVEAKNWAENHQRANQASDAFSKAKFKLADAQQELWEAVQEANAELGFQDRLQDGFATAFSALGVALLIVGTLGASALVVGAAGATVTALDWANSAARQYNPNENEALDKWAKANDVAGLIPGARLGFQVAGAGAGMIADGNEILTTKPVGISSDVYSPSARQGIRDSIDWSKDANGEYVKGPYQDRARVDQEKIKAALDKTEEAQAEFDIARAAYELAERRRFSRSSWSQPKGG